MTNLFGTAAQIAAGLLLLALAPGCQRPSSTTNATSSAEPEVALPEAAQDLVKSDTEEAAPRSVVFAGGCFWCTEAVFEELGGVLAVVSGYAGGTAESANYKAVSAGSTDHAEVIRITFDPTRITYAKLLEVFFSVAHDPTQLNYQGPDHGTQYRSAIFYADDDEKKTAAAYIQQLTDETVFREPIATTLEPLTEFYPAEDYHQDYVVHNPRHGYVVRYALPKIAKLSKYFPELVREK